MQLSFKIDETFSDDFQALHYKRLQEYFTAQTFNKIFSNGELGIWRFFSGIVGIGSLDLK